MALYYIARHPDGTVAAAWPHPHPAATEVVCDSDPAVAEQIAALAPPPSLVERVRAEAERRIAAGILVNGKPFRCDEISAGRIDRMAEKLAAKPPGTTQTFTTFAGDTFTINATQAAAISDAVADYQSAIIGTSSALQANPPADPTDDAHWPAKMRVTLA